MSDNSPYEAPESDVAVSSGQSKLSLKQIYFSFDGRIPRKVFWLHGILGIFATTLVASFVLGILSGILGEWVMVLSIPLFVPLIWAYLGIYIKRWHDRNKSGWWILIMFIPFIGGLWMLVECGFLQGTEGDNQFGPEPGDY